MGWQSSSLRVTAEVAVIMLVGMRGVSLWHRPGGREHSSTRTIFDELANDKEARSRAKYSTSSTIGRPSSCASLALL